MSPLNLLVANARASGSSRITANITPLYIAKINLARASIVIHKKGNWK